MTSTANLYAPLRPWRDLLHPSHLSRPYSFSDASTRLRRNLHHFRANYAFIVLIFLFLSLLWRPLAMFVFLVIFVAWMVFYLFRESPVVVVGRVVDDRVVVGVLGVVTVAGLVVVGVGANVVVGLGVGVGVVGLHAVVRSAEDLFLDEQEAAGGGLLSVVGSSNGRGSGSIEREIY